jgi:hypothetical protein
MRIALVIGALVAAPAALAAQATSSVERFEEPYDALVENPCNGETVQITGTLMITERITVDANGVTHRSFTLVPNVRGQGASGAYKVVGGDRSTVKFIDGQLDPENFNGTFQFNIISQGNAPNFITTVSAHFTSDADGTIKRDFFHENARCTGG